MADYESAPRVVEEDQIRLYGKPYRISKPVHVQLSTVLPGKTVQGDYGKDDNPTISTYTVSDLMGGPGLFRYRDTARDINRYTVSIRGDDRWSGAITAQQEFTTITRPAAESSSAKINCITSLGGTLIVIYYDTSPGTTINLYNYSGSAWSAIIDTPPGLVVGPPTYFSGKLFYPATTQYFYQSSASGAITYCNGAGDPFAISFAVWDNKLWALDSSYKLWWSSTGASLSWNFMADPIPFDDEGTTGYGQLKVYDDENRQPTLWAFTHIGPYVWDGSTVRWVRSRFSHPYYHYTGVAFTFRNAAVCNWRGKMLVNTGPQEVYQLVMTSDGLTVEDISPCKDDGMYYSNLCIRTLLSDNYYAYALMSANPTQSNDAPTVVMMWDGVAWRSLYQSSLANTADPTQMYILDNATGRRLYVTGMEGGAVHDLSYTNLRTLREHPTLLTFTGGGLGKEYTTSATFLLPWFTADYPGQQKLALQYRVKLLGADANNYMSLAYYLNGSSSSTALSNVTSNTESTVRLGTSQVGVAFKSWRWNWGFTTAGSTSAAKAEYVALDYLRIPDTWKGFIVEIDCTEDSPDHRSPKQQVDDIWTAISTSTLGTFAYRDDAGNTRSYLVKITVPQGEELTGVNETGHYTLLLTSYGSNN